MVVIWPSRLASDLRHKYWKLSPAYLLALAAFVTLLFAVAALLGLMEWQLVDGVAHH